jgi:hypothetical protein
MANTNPHKALPELTEQSVLSPINANITEINFARRVEVLENGCWLWHGSFQPAKASNGYKRRPLLWSGQGRLSGKMVFAHRYAYESRVAELPDQRYFGLEQDCSTELCVNPRHYILTQRKVFADDARPSAFAVIRANPMCKNELHERTPENTATIKIKNGGTRTTCKPCLKKSASEASKRHKAKKKLAN